MKFLCWFRQCRWVWIVNGWLYGPRMDDPLQQVHSETGIYQCTRCKTISIGSPCQS